jgi:hypothetical protein
MNIIECVVFCVRSHQIPLYSIVPSGGIRSNRRVCAERRMPAFDTPRKVLFLYLHPSSRRCAMPLYRLSSVGILWRTLLSVAALVCSVVYSVSKTQTRAFFLRLMCAKHRRSIAAVALLGFMGSLHSVWRWLDDYVSNGGFVSTVPLLSCVVESKMGCRWR